MRKIIFAIPALFFQFYYNISAEDFTSVVSEYIPSQNENAAFITVFDYGARIEKIIVNAGRDIEVHEFKSSLDDFKVEQRIKTKLGLYDDKASLEIEKKYLCDEKGNERSEKSNFIALEFNPGIEEKKLSPFQTSLQLMSDNDFFYEYAVENSSLNLKVNHTAAYICKEASAFKIEKSKKYHYSSYIPEKGEKDKKIPLIVWFHGMGENGSNPYRALLGVKASSLAGEEIQSFFENGCAVLIPQSEDSWLKTKDKGPFGVNYWAPVEKNMPENTLKNAVKAPFKLMDKLVSKIPLNKKKTEENTEPEIERDNFAAVSLYSEDVKELLDEFLENHPEIDRKRIYAGGCSAGGYMTLNMVIQYPQFFAAAFPVCEYYPDSKITDEQLQSLVNIPLWFTWAENDTTVKPENASAPTVRRLKKYGHSNIHTSIFKEVKTSDGQEYPGHYSWIYVLNNQAEENGLKLFEWLSQQ